jgi:hypothetical protein
MGMMSKQDMDVAVKVLQDKVEFIMRAFNVSQPSALLGMPPTMKSLLQVYYEVKAGLSLQEAVGAEDVETEGDSVSGEVVADGGDGVANPVAVGE